MLLGKRNGKISALYFMSLVLIILGSNISYAEEEHDPGQINFRSHIAETQDEYIDPYTGVVRLKYLDFSLPGNGGLDLNIYRVYSSAGAASVMDEIGGAEGDSMKIWRYSALGFGWDIHFGRMTHNTKYITVELGDGTTAEMIRQEPLDDVWLSSEMWKLKYVPSTGGQVEYTLYLPDGTEIDFAQFNPGSVSGKLLGYRYATEIRKNGNKITINYDIGPRADSRKIVSVVDSLGREIEFQYETYGYWERLKRIYFVDQNKVVVQYNYPAGNPDDNRLSSTMVSAETGIGDTYTEKWLYRYNIDVDGDKINGSSGPLALTQVHNPMGGVTYYQYEKYSRDCTNWVGKQSSQYSLRKKFLGGNNLGPDIVNVPNGTPVWEYFYSENNTNTQRVSNYAGIKDPEGRWTHYYFVQSNFQSDARFKTGLVERKIIEEANGTVSFVEENTWGKLPYDSLIDYYEVPLEYGGTCMHPEGSWAIPKLESKTTIRGNNVMTYDVQGIGEGEEVGAWEYTYDGYAGVNASVYTTLYTSYDKYGNPTTISEIGEQYDSNGSSLWSLSKTTTKGYWTWNDPYNYIVRGKPSLVSVSSNNLIGEGILHKGSDSIPANDTFTISYQYYENPSNAYEFGQLQEIDRYGISKAFEYGSVVGSSNYSNLTEITDAELHSTSYDWQWGVVSDIYEPLYSPAEPQKFHTERDINVDGTVHYEIDGRGNKTTYHYNNNRRLIRIEPDQEGNETWFDYLFDSNGKLTGVRERNVGVTNTTYVEKSIDGLGRTYATVDSIGVTTSKTFLKNGLLDYENSSIGDTTYYDFWGRVVNITHAHDQQHPGNNFITYDYISDGEIEITDETRLNSKTHYFKFFADPGEKYLTKIVDQVKLQINDPLTYDTAVYEYNVLGNLLGAYRGTGLTLGTSNEKLAYRYSAGSDLLDFARSRESGITDYSHWPDGKVKFVVDDAASSSPELRTKEYIYDANNNTKEVKANNQIEKSFTYYGDNLVHTSSTLNVSETFVYDNLDRLRTITTCSTPAQSTLCKSSQYFYDNNDNLEYIIYPSGLRVDYGYNSINQVNRVYNFHNGELNYITYYGGTDHRAGLLRQYTRANGDLVSFDYNGRRNTKSIQADSVSLGYLYDSRGNLERLTRSGWASDGVYGYDELNRIRSFTGPWGNGEYRYAPGSDNRVYKSIDSNEVPWDYTIYYAYDSSKNSVDSYTKSFPGGSNPPVDFTFGNGNMTRMGNKTFEYDPFHMVKKVKASGTTIAEYGYSAGNMRAFKKYSDNPDDITFYFRDGSGKILSEVNGLGLAIFDYVYLNGKLVAKVKGYRPPTPNYGPIIAPINFLLLGN